MAGNSTSLSWEWWEIMILNDFQTQRCLKSARQYLFTLIWMEGISNQCALKYTNKALKLIEINKKRQFTLS